MPRVAAVHDLSGYGLCSLAVALPVLATMQVDTCPLLTAYLSSHTGYEGFTFADMTDELTAVVDHWQLLGLRFDALYSGFLGSARQIGVVEHAIETFAPPVVLVDPVMGDNGRVYKTYTAEMCALMRRLADRATLLTPNLTEAAILLGQQPDTMPSDAQLRDWLVQLAEERRDVVLTGLRDGDSVTTLVYSRDTGTVSEVSRSFVGCDYHGTGDLFASVLLGAVLNGKTLAEACALAADFVAAAARYTADHLPQSRDIAFAPVLGRLISL